MEPLAATMLALGHKLMGSVLVLFGLVVLPMPIPVGLIMIVIGLALLAPYFRTVQRLVRHLRRKSPMIDRNLLRMKSHCPPVIQQTIEKTNPRMDTDTQAA